MKEFHRDFANRTGFAQAWTVKSADRLFTRLQTQVFYWYAQKAAVPPRFHRSFTVRRRSVFKPSLGENTVQCGTLVLQFFFARAPFGPGGLVAECIKVGCGTLVLQDRAVQMKLTCPGVS